MGEWVEWADDADCPLPWEVVGEDGSNVTDMGLRIAGGGTELLVPIGPKNGEKAPTSGSMTVCGGWGEGGGSEERRVERELTRRWTAHADCQNPPGKQQCRGRARRPERKQGEGSQ